MKVKDIVKKLNLRRAKLPVYTRTGFEEPVRLSCLAELGYHDYKEAERTVTSIDLEADKVIINYK